MKRALITAAALVALVVVVLLPLLTSDGSASGDPETTSISRYAAAFTVSSAGDLTATETLKVFFPSSDKHGIFRFFDRTDPSAPRADRTPYDVQVTRDGEPDQVDLTEESDGRYLVARIGRPDVVLPQGEHTYVITYRVDHVLEPGTGGQPTQFYWNLIPSGWRQAIHESHLTVHLPARAQDVRCAVGVGATSGCRVLTNRSGADLTVDTGLLGPHTPVTLQAGLDVATPAQHLLPWATKYEPVIGSSWGGVLAVLGGTVLAGAAGFGLSRGSHEREPAQPVQYAPPDGVGPAGGLYVVREQVDQQAFVASLMLAAEGGAVDLRRDGDGWGVTDRLDTPAWSRLDPVTRSLSGLLTGPGGTLEVRRKDVAAGEQLHTALQKFGEQTRTWAREQGYVARAGLGGVGGLAVVLAAVVAGWAAIGGWFGMSLTGVVPGAFALAASPLLSRGSATRRTAKGRAVWSRVGGFVRILRTPSSKERFDFAARRDLYLAYLPWAVAFGCAEAWAKKYRTEVGQEPPVPAYFGGYAAGSSTDMVSRMVGDFSSTLQSSISAYQATQHSSGGSSGGFSGGGGGGGGGGGSW